MDLSNTKFSCIKCIITLSESRLDGVLIGCLFGHSSLNVKFSSLITNNSNIQVVDHRVFVPGRWFNEDDRDFWVIEKCQKIPLKQNLHSPPLESGLLQSEQFSLCFERKLHRIVANNGTGCCTITWWPDIALTHIECTNNYQKFKKNLAYLRIIIRLHDPVKRVQMVLVNILESFLSLGPEIVASFTDGQCDSR